MPSKKIIFLVTGLVVLIMIVTAILAIWNNKSTKTSNNQPSNQSNSTAPAIIEPIIKSEPRPEITNDQEAIERLAQIIGQRTWTYQNFQTAGVDSLQPIFVPSTFTAFKREWLKIIQNENIAGAYTSSAVSTNNYNINGNTATITIRAQQVKSNGESSPNQEKILKLTFTKPTGGSASDWKVSTFSF